MADLKEGAQAQQRDSTKPPVRRFVGTTEAFHGDRHEVSSILRTGLLNLAQSEGDTESGDFM